MTFLDDYFRERVGEISNEKTTYTMPPPTVIKMSANILVSNELLMDMGIIPDTRPPLEYKSIPLPWRTRFRWWRSRQRDRFATWAYERISGDKFPDPYDD